MLFSIVAISSFLFLAGGLAALLFLSARWAVAWFTWPPIVLAAGWLDLWHDPKGYRPARDEWGMGRMLDAVELSVVAGYLCAAFLCWLLWLRLKQRPANIGKPD